MFPKFEDWCDTVLHSEDTHPWNFRTYEFYKEYRLKYALAKMIRPRSILEIGVRFGYSAQSFLFAAPDASYLGLDKDEPSWGPYQGVPRQWAHAALLARYPHNDICTWKTDTQCLKIVENFKQYDLVHIDGDHSYDGALHDMTTFWQCCARVMVVDDIAEIKDVARAVRTFLGNTPSAIYCGDVTATRGAALIVRENA